MSKLFRALVISALATGTAVVVLNMIQKQSTPVPKQEGDGFVDAEQLSDEEKELLSNELDAML